MGLAGAGFKKMARKEALPSLHGLEMAEQRQRLESLFDAWKGPYPQTDDVLPIGFRWGAPLIGHRLAVFPN
jgi:hypothetical protein